MRRAWLPWAGLAISIALLIIGGALTAAGDGDLTEVLASVLLAVPFAAVGALVAARQPGNRIGWLLLGIGFCFALAGAADGAIRYGLAHPPSTVSPGALALISASSFSTFFLLLYLVLLLLPNGRLPSPRWRAVTLGVLVLALVDIALLVRDGPFDDWDEEGILNPLGITALQPVTDVLYQVAFLLSALLLVGSIGSVVVRFRRSIGIERAQLRWIAAAVTATLASWVTMIVGSVILGDRPAVDILWGVAILSISFIPVGIGIAVMRYRLYEIDRVISRTLVYAAVTVVLGASYVGLVLAGQALFSSFAGGSDLAIAASTLAVAALFLPVRSSVQRFVDRRFYRRRYDAQRTLEVFGARLRDQVDLETLSIELRGAVSETMQPSTVNVWLREGSR